MKGCILDSDTLDRADIELGELLNQLEDWDIHSSTKHNEARERIHGSEVVITNKVRLDRDTIDSSSKLKLVMLAATGTDNVDLDACKERGIIVTNARQYSNPAVVQHTFTLMLALMTNLIAYQEDVKRGVWCESDIFCLLDHPIRELENKVIGIIGYGNLGSAVASVAKAFGMQVVICQRPNSPAQAGRLSLEELLKVADVVSLHCPLTPDTHHLICAEQFCAMKNDAILINTARGAIVNTVDLAQALKQGQIAGAGIDVLDQEPPAKDYPLLANGIPNLILTPHNAWATRESRQRLVTQMSQILAAWIQGSPINVVT